MSNWDKTEPGGRELISSGASRIREIKDALEVAFGEEHDFPDTSYHKIPYGTSVAGYEGRWRYNNTTKTIERHTSGSWVSICLTVDMMAAGTKTIFFQSSAPVGWTQDTTFGNDEFLNVLSSGSISSGGSWDPEILAYSSDHSHIIANSDQTFTHAYTAGDRNSGAIQATMAIPPISGHSYSHNHAISSSGTHQHIITSGWRPEYMDVIVATKD